MATQAAKQGMTGSRRSAAAVRNPVLASKITAPDVPDWTVQRPRITNLVTQGLRWSPLVIVTGPLGAGKTMAVASWTAAEPGPVAWVSLDEYDNQPGVFWSYVVAALRRSGIDVPRELSAPARGRSAEHLFLLRLASALAAQYPPVTLVVDDFHLLTEQKVLTGLDFLLRNVGSGLRLVLVSRTDPLLPLCRYRLGGKLAEVRASDLAFSTDEAGLLLAQHGCTVSADSLDCLMRQTEGWVAGLRLAAISMTGHHDPDQFVKELAAEDSVLTGFLVEEVLNTQPPQVRELLLSTSILEHVNAGVAGELTGNEQAGRILSGLAHANAFVQPIGGGWYRYHTLFGEALRLKLHGKHPDRIALLHQRAACWYERNGRLAEAVRHAAQAGDWPVVARIVIDSLAINLAAARRTGDFTAAAKAAARAETLVNSLPGNTLARRPELRARILSARGAAELWSGRFDEAARLIGSGVAAATASGQEHERIDCLGQLALVEALRGQLGRAAKLADQAVVTCTGDGQRPVPYSNAAALVTLAWVHVVHQELGEARSRLKQLDAALRVSPDKLIGAVACLIATWIGLAEGRADVAARFAARARSGCCIPAWLEQQLNLAESRAMAAAGAHRHLVTRPMPSASLPAPADAPGEAGIPAVEPLTEREREVLRRVSGMLTTAEIASELYISTNTVKSHIKNVCHKLAVGRRGEAVRRARQLQLI